MGYVVNGDRLLLRPAKAMDKTEAGIILTAEAEERDRGEVVAVGLDVKDNRFRVGQTVIFAAGHGYKTKIDGEELSFIESELVFLAFE